MAMPTPTQVELVAHRRTAATWYAWGRMDGDRLRYPTHLNPFTFGKFAQAEAGAHYLRGENGFSLESIHEQWARFTANHGPAY